MTDVPHMAGFVVGPEKTASTFIQSLLEHHPDVRLPRGIKETFFFDRFFGNGRDWYLSRFDLSGEAPYLVEVAPSYFCEDEAAARIKNMFPDARIVICARDPVERTVSHYRHMRRYGYVDAPLADALDAGKKPLKASLYSRYCPLWSDLFGAQNVHVLDMRVLSADPAKFAADVFRALGLRQIAVPEAVLNDRVNEAVEPGSYQLAKFATSVSNWMKQRGLYAILNVLRNSPVHKLVYGSRKSADRPNVEAEVLEKLARDLAPEYAFLADKCGLDFRALPADKSA